MNNQPQPTLWGMVIRTAVVHTLTYFVAGLIASNLFGYATLFAEPGYRSFMRQFDDPMVGAGVLFQPIRGALFGLVFYLLRDVLFRRRDGWLITWVMLVVVGILSTFGPTPGSIEGLVYTTLSLASQLRGLPEVLTQSLLLSVLTFYWVTHPEKRWLSWTLGILFVIALLLPVLGLLVSRAAP